MLPKEKYKIIKIQNLKPVKQKYNYSSNTDTCQQWKSTKCQHWDEKCKCSILAYEENCSANINNHVNSFYGAFLEAYNNHEDIVLSPDDVWMAICLHFSRYINNNSEKLRDMFVSHSGKKKLTVTTWNEIKESEWNEFFDLMIQEIRKNTKDGIVDLLKSNFTTTGHIESILSIATVMDSFKKYFDYGRCIPLCGIRNVCFMGTLEDWESLLQKTLNLKKYAITNEWGTYIEKLQPLLQKFIDTYKGNVDVDFWNKVMNITHGSLGSGSTTYVSGWILNFFGIYSSVEADEIKAYSIDVPVEIDNKMTGTKKMVNIVGGFGGVSKVDGACRPQLSMIVYWDGSEDTTNAA